jgi:hypothetical protein
MQAEPVLDREGRPTGEYQYQAQPRNARQPRSITSSVLDGIVAPITGWTKLQTAEAMFRATHLAVKQFDGGEAEARPLIW